MTGELYEVTIADLVVLRGVTWSDYWEFRDSYRNTTPFEERITALDAEIARRQALENT